MLLDEATSSVDYATDQSIQNTIAKEFGDGSTTVLTIAHRLNTVLHMDKIVVMEDGRVAECGSPTELLTKKGSLFGRLVLADRLQRASDKGQ